jgi:hypothetical protein
MCGGDMTRLSGPYRGDVLPPSTWWGLVRLMETRSSTLRVAACAASLLSAHMSIGQTPPTQRLIDVASSFSRSLSWPFDGARTHGELVTPQRPNVWMLTTKTALFIIDDAGSRVLVATNLKADHDRRTVPRSGTRFRDTGPEWITYATSKVAKGWPGMTLKSIRVDKYALNDTAMRSTTSRTVRVQFTVWAPTQHKDAKVTVVMDSDTGAVLVMSYSPKQ